MAGLVAACASSSVVRHRVFAASSSGLPDALIVRLAADPDVSVRAALASNRFVPASSVVSLASDSSVSVRSAAATRSLGPDLLGGLLRDSSPDVAAAAMANPQVDPAFLRSAVLSSDTPSSVRQAGFTNPVLFDRPSWFTARRVVKAGTDRQFLSFLLSNSACPDSVFSSVSPYPKSSASQVVSAVSNSKCPGLLREELLGSLTACLSSPVDRYELTGVLSSSFVSSQFLSAVVLADPVLFAPAVLNPVLSVTDLLELFEFFVSKPDTGLVCGLLSYRLLGFASRFSSDLLSVWAQKLFALPAADLAVVSSDVLLSLATSVLPGLPPDAVLTVLSAAADSEFGVAVSSVNPVASALFSSVFSSRLSEVEFSSATSVLLKFGVSTSQLPVAVLPVSVSEAVEVLASVKPPSRTPGPVPRRR